MCLFNKDYNLQLLQWYTFMQLQTRGFSSVINFVLSSCMFHIVVYIASLSQWHWLQMSVGRILFPESQNCLLVE
jgi:hypothetical protein